MPPWRRWEKPFDVGDDVVLELWPERAVEGEHLDLDAQLGAGAGGRENGGEKVGHGSGGMELLRAA